MAEEEKKIIPAYVPTADEATVYTEVVNAIVKGREIINKSYAQFNNRSLIKQPFVNRSNRSITVLLLPFRSFFGRNRSFTVPFIFRLYRSVYRTVPFRSGPFLMTVQQKPSKVNS